MKSYILTKHVFPSMANITTFLEFTNLPPLQSVFEDDIEELLLGANSNSEFGREFKSKIKSKLTSKSKVREQDVSWLRTDHWHEPVITRLLHAMMTWNVAEDKHNFRLRMLPILIRIIYDYLWVAGQSALAAEEDPSLSSPTGKLADEKFHEIMNNDLKNVILLIDVLTKNANTKKGDANRPVLF